VVKKGPQKLINFLCLQIAAPNKGMHFESNNFAIAIQTKRIKIKIWLVSESQLIEKYNIKDLMRL